MPWLCHGAEGLNANCQMLSAALITSVRLAGVPPIPATHPLC